MRVPVASMNSSAAMCWLVPTPLLAKFSPPGLALASAMKPCTSLARELAGTVITSGTLATCASAVTSRSGSKGGAFIASGTWTLLLTVPRVMTCPSGFARAVATTAMVPPPPVRFSTATGWPSSSDSFGAISRARMSVPPPGAKPTSRVIGRLGKGTSCACTPKGSSAAASSMRRSMVGPSPSGRERLGAEIARQRVELRAQRRRDGHALDLPPQPGQAALLAGQPDAVDAGQPLAGAQVARERIHAAAEFRRVAEGGDVDGEHRLAGIGDAGVVRV